MPPNLHFVMRRTAARAVPGRARVRPGPVLVPRPPQRRRTVSAGAVLGAAAVLLAATALAVLGGRRIPRPFPRPLPVPSVARHGASLRPARGGALAILVLGPAARGGTDEVLELLPAIDQVRVQWVVPPGTPDEIFQLSVAREGKALKTVGQLGGLREAGGNRVAEFDLDAGLFAGFADATRFRFGISARSSGITAGAYPVVIRKTLD